MSIINVTLSWLLSLILGSLSLSMMSEIRAFPLFLIAATVSSLPYIFVMLIVLYWKKITGFFQAQCIHVLLAAMSFFIIFFYEQELSYFVLVYFCWGLLFQCSIHIYSKKQSTNQPKVPLDSIKN